jgi:hypothetical protein
MSLASVFMLEVEVGFSVLQQRRLFNLWSSAGNDAPKGWNCSKNCWCFITLILHKTENMAPFSELLMGMHNGGKCIWCAMTHNAWHAHHCQPLLQCIISLEQKTSLPLLDQFHVCGKCLDAGISQYGFRRTIFILTNVQFLMHQRSALKKWLSNWYIVLFSFRIN